MNAWMLLIEAARPPCMHCWARGGAYPARPFADARLAIEQFVPVCNDASCTVFVSKRDAVAMRKDVSLRST